MKTTARFDVLRERTLKKLFSIKNLTSVWRGIVKSQMRTLDIIDLHDYYDFNLSIEDRAKEIISLEGIGSATTTEKPGVYYYASNEKNAKKLEGTGAKILKEGIVMGTTGILLLKQGEGIPITTISKSSGLSETISFVMFSRVLLICFESRIIRIALTNL